MSVHIHPPSVTAAAGSAVTLSVTVTPPTRIEWSSSDPSVAAVSRTGHVVMLQPGTTVITATTPGGASGSATVTVA